VRPIVTKKWLAKAHKLFCCQTLAPCHSSVPGPSGHPPPILPEMQITGKSSQGLRVPLPEQKKAGGVSLLGPLPTNVTG
jgi:hypothetical protein